MTAPNLLFASRMALGEAWRLLNLQVRRSVPQLPPLSLPAQSSGLVVQPDNLRPGDARMAREFYSGVFTFSGRSVHTHGESPFDMAAPSADWFQHLHGFQWLSHLEAADSGLSRTHAMALVLDWTARHGKPNRSPVWQTRLAAMRLIAWLNAAHLMADDPTPARQVAFVQALQRHVWHLQRTTAHARPGLPSLKTQIALVYGMVCLGEKEKTLRLAVRDLERTMDRQILPDGVHITRNPVSLVDVLTDLIPLENLFQKSGQAGPQNLHSAIDRMVLALRFFQHGDGSLAQFNGTGSTPKAQLDAILSQDRGLETPPISAPHGGYERLAKASTIVLIDTGAPVCAKVEAEPFAGTLSFELSSNKTVFISNCGVPELDRSTYLPFARASAAHSTAVLGDASSSRFRKQSPWQAFFPNALLDGPRSVRATRKVEGRFETLRASHDGYLERFSLIHERVLSLSKDGSTLQGIDRFIPANPNRTMVPVPFAIRFHLPPGISASPLSNGHSILLAAQSRAAWTVSCTDAPIDLEESICFSGDGSPRKTEQMVISGDASGATEIRWQMERRSTRPSPKTKKTVVENGETPPFQDLLYGLEPDLQDA
ncbi:MAG: heparinase II/III family protein [Pseudomonadota bacterium]